MKIINNYKDFIYFYKSLEKLALYKGNFSIFSSFILITITIYSFSILIENEAISRAKN
ncbi:hypothetical protein C8034_v001797 [Colletotrichum sidae]|uniref:Uncharacterized protein n=1 Tax=Colletotrichum sidae TaxID=1347389 RepID=A0A4R8SSG5_9PEZI|nr:hypothetical protein C8034_v001797 [Colletotrichum sidae]